MEIFACRTRDVLAVLPAVGVLLSMVLGGNAQRTHMRSCDCEYVENGRCAYTLFLPLTQNALPSGGGTCPNSSGASSDSVPAEQLKILTSNVTDLQRYSLEQSHMISQLQSTFITTQQTVTSLAIRASNNTVEMGDSIRELQSKVDTIQYFLNDLQNTLPTNTSKSLQVANDTLTSRAKELEDALKASENRVQLLESRIARLEKNITVMRQLTGGCRQVVMAADRNATYTEGVSVSVSSQFNLDHGINKVSVYNTITPLAWCPGGGNENGVCPSSSSSSPGEGSTAELEEGLQQLAQNISDLQSWTGEQAKTLIALQNALTDQNMLLGALQSGDFMSSLQNQTCVQCEALQQIVDMQQEMFQTLSTGVAEQAAAVTAMTQTAQESLDSVQTSREQLLDANSRILELSRKTDSMEEEILDLKTKYHLCKSKGMLVSGDIASILDSSIVGSSTFDEKHTPDRVRINTGADALASGAWCPSEPNQEEEWIQFDLGSPKVIFGVLTRGRADYAQWVTSYSLQYADAPFAGVDPVYMQYQDVLGDTMIFQGNSDQNTAQTNMLWQPVTAQFIRIIPITSHENRNKCMRADVIGCVDAS